MGFTALPSPVSHLLVLICPGGRFRLGSAWLVLPRNTSRILRKIVGDREPRGFARDKGMGIRANAGIIVQGCQPYPEQRGSGWVGACASRALIEFVDDRRATNSAKSSIAARRGFVKRH